jgi:hypothetical protein
LFLVREGEAIGYHVLVAFDVLGCKAGVAMHENGGEVTGDLQVCVVARILVIQTRSAVEPSDGRGSTAECYDAWESADLGRCGFKPDFQEHDDGHAEEFEKVIDFFVTVQYARRWDRMRQARPRVFSYRYRKGRSLKSKIGTAVALQ